VNLQGRNLFIDIQGDDARLLHSEVRQVDFDVPDDEMLQDFFGQGTRDAVTRF